MDNGIWGFKCDYKVWKLIENLLINWLEGVFRSWKNKHLHGTRCGWHGNNLRRAVPCWVSGSSVFSIDISLFVLMLLVLRQELISQELTEGLQTLFNPCLTGVIYLHLRRQIWTWDEWLPYRVARWFHSDATGMLRTHIQTTYPPPTSQRRELQSKRIDIVIQERPTLFVACPRMEMRVNRAEQSQCKTIGRKEVVTEGFL